MRRFWKLLTDEQVKHLRECRIRNERQFWEARNKQRSFTGLALDDGCLECRSIETRISRDRNWLISKWSTVSVNGIIDD